MALHMMPRTTNLLTANQSSVETDLTGLSRWPVGDTEFIRDTSIAWQGGASARLTRINVAGIMAISSAGFYVPVTPVVVYTSSVCARAEVAAGRRWQLELRWLRADSSTIGAVFTPLTAHTPGAWVRLAVTGTSPADAAFAIMMVWLESAAVGERLWWDGALLEPKSYPTSWHLGGSTRAAQKLSTVTPSVLPSDCGIGAIVKMDLASTQTGLPSMTFARQGGYHLYLDTVDKKLKCTNGVVTVATPALTWAVGGVIDGYGGRIDGKLFVRARVNAGAAQYAEAVADHVDSGTLFYGGERNIGLDFDGVDDFLAVTDYAGIQNIFDGGGTVAAWIKPRGMGGANLGKVYSKAQSLLRLFDLSAGTAYLQLIREFSTTNGEWRTTNRVITLDTMHHVQVAYNSGSVANVPVIRIDGSEVGVTTLTAPVGTRVTDVGSNLIIGNRVATDRSFNGQISNFRMWRGIRPNADDRFLRLIGNEANLAAAWPMDECTGATALNIVAGGNNAAITGSVWAAEQVMHGKVYDVRRDDRRKDVAAKLGVS